MSLELHLFRLVLEQESVRTHEMIARPIVAHAERLMQAAHMIEVEPGCWEPTSATADWIERIAAKHQVYAPPVDLC